jgi:hypothetical protein
LCFCVSSTVHQSTVPFGTRTFLKFIKKKIIFIAFFSSQKNHPSGFGLLIIRILFIFSIYSFIFVTHLFSFSCMWQFWGFFRRCKAHNFPSFNSSHHLRLPFSTYHNLGYVPFLNQIDLDNMVPSNGQSIIIKRITEVREEGRRQLFASMM